MAAGVLKSALVAGPSVLPAVSARPANVVPATTSNGPLLPANTIEYVIVNPGQKLSVIQNSATGALNVTEMS